MKCRGLDVKDVFTALMLCVQVLYGKFGNSINLEE